MLNTIAFLVFLCSILIMFSQEINNFVKKIFSYFGVRLFLPLLLASSFLIYYEPWLAWWLLEIKRWLHQLSILTGDLITFAPSELFAIILIMTFCASLPIVITYLWKKKTGVSLKYGEITGVFVWLIMAILYTVNYSYSIY